MRSRLAFLADRQAWPPIAALVVLMLWAQFGAPVVGLASFNSVAFYQSAYLQSLPPAPDRPAVSSQVVIVVVDGLRVDTSHQMPTINDARSRGADRVMRVGQPSLSLPGWTVIGTGAWQEQSGVATNYTTDRIALDTIFLAAKRKGLATALVGDEAWRQLYTTGIDTSRYTREPPDRYTNVNTVRRLDESIANDALLLLREKPNLALIHLLGPDLAAHGWGGASSELADVAQHVDRQLARILAALDLRDATVFITADHGHLDRGGHGGPEAVVLHVPFVALGNGIKPGTYGEAAQAGIAPTVAALLGTGMPAHNQGDAMLDVIAAPAAVLALRAVDNAQQVTTRYQQMISTIGDAREIDRQTLSRADAALAAGNAPDAIELSRRASDQARSTWMSARDDRLARERLQRFPIALVVLLPFAAYLWFWRRKGWAWRAPLIAAATYFVLWNVNYFLVKGYTYSLSVYNLDTNVKPFLTARVTEAMAALVIAMLVVGALRAGAPAGSMLRDAVNTIVAIVGLLIVQVLAWYFWWDVTFAWYLPDLPLGFKYYLDIFQTTALWPLPYLPLGALLPLVALGASWVAGGLARRLRPHAKPEIAPG